MRTRRPSSLAHGGPERAEPSQAPDPSGKGFGFTTPSGAQYHYDDLTGRVHAIGPFPSSGVGGELPTETHEKGVPLVEPQGIHPSHVTEYLERDGYKELLLIITERCNLRCRYCAYSGNYETMRLHSDSSMTRDVMETAILTYLRGFMGVKRFNPYRRPVIGFYGGEPLLRSDLIRSAVAFAKTVYPLGIDYTITTNGLLLRTSIADFLRRNDFHLAVSLNGHEQEHDRLRVDEHGNGSFSGVWRNLQHLRKRDEIYYRERCTVLACHDTGTDLLLVDAFFENNRSILPILGRASPVMPHFTDWYGRYSHDQQDLYGRRREACKQRYSEDLLQGRTPNPFLEALIGQGYRQIMMRPQQSFGRPAFLAHTAACVPGEKIAVAPSGAFHCCERINESFPIGDAKSGIDIHGVVRMLELYREQILQECRDCPVTRLCTICFASVAGRGSFRRSPADVCTRLREDIKRRIVELWGLFEQGVLEEDILRSQKAHIDL